MEDFEMEKDKMPKNRKAGKNAVKIGVIAFVILAVLMICNISGCQKNDIDEIYGFEGDSNYQICEYQGEILAISYDGIKFLNFNGDRKNFVENHMSAPHYDVSGSMILLYDRGDKKVAVYNGSEKKYSYECDQPIKSAKINKNGYAVIISDEVAYNSKVTVLNSTGEVEYVWKIGNEYIVDADLSADNKKLVAATITTDTGVIVENIVFVDIKLAEEFGRVKNTGDMPLEVKYTDSGSIIAVSDTKLCAYDAKGKERWNIPFENNTLQIAEIDESGNCVVALRGIKNDTIVRMYTKGGSKSGEYVTKTLASHISVNHKNIAICEGSEISVINYSGKLLASEEVKKEIRDIKAVSENKVLLLCDDCIQLLKI